LVRAHYPLMDIARLEADYPSGVGAEWADELRLEEMEHAAAITKDIILCPAAAPPTTGKIELYICPVPVPPSLASSEARSAPSSTTPKVSEPPKSQDAGSSQQ
jgi:hypothetical protein